MRNTILLICLSLFFSFNLTGCSLFSSSDDEAETATVAEDQSGEGAETSEMEDEFASDDFEAGEGADDAFDPEEIVNEGGESEIDDLAAGDIEVEDNFGGDGVDEYPDDDYAAKGASAVGAETASLDEDFIDDNSFASDDSFAVEDSFGGDSLSVDEGGGIPDTAMSDNQEEDLFGGDSPVVDTPSYSDSSFASDSFSSDSFSDPISDTPQFVPVKKMKPAAYMRAGNNINRLYVVRPGDTMDSIASKIYGSNRSDDLYKWNSHFQGKEINVGDKIYYESPNNPNDQSMMTYYEDNNIGPQYYTSQEGDNIRKIAKNLLGHSRSWMEIYATNPNVDSKGRLSGGLQLRYWIDGAEAPTPAPAPVIAQNEEPVVEEAPQPEPAPIEEPADVAMNEPEPMDMGEGEDIMGDATEVAQMDEPQPFENGVDESDIVPPPAAGSVAPPPPPKPIAPPPPPPSPVAEMNKNKAPSKMPVIGGSPLDEMANDSTIMAALGGLFILAMIIVLIFIRRSRSKRVNFSQTQV